MPSSKGDFAGGAGGYLALGERVFLKRLEEPCAYAAGTDDLYELSPEALELLRRCDGSRLAEELAPDPGFLSFCLEEGVLEALRAPAPPGSRDVSVGENSRPSLRYLMLEVTDRCNLRCLHCYLGDAGTTDLDLDAAGGVLEEFGRMGGLRLMVTGGEPLLYPHFDELNRSLEGRPYRRVLLTNGTLLRDADYRALNFDEVQFSLDGLEGGHDFLRGRGGFRRTVRAVEDALGAGLQVSVATVLHARNLGEVEELGRRLEGMGVSSWTLEFPVPEGRLRERPELMPGLDPAVPMMGLEWGSGVHEGAAGQACGAHLACVLPSGRLVKCDYYPDICGGGVAGGLRRAWEALPRMAVEGECAGCEELAECGGGCRYRALLLAGEGGPDPVMCRRRGRDPGSGAGAGV